MGYLTKFIILVMKHVLFDKRAPKLVVQTQLCLCFVISFQLILLMCRVEEHFGRTIVQTPLVTKLLLLNC